MPELGCDEGGCVGVLEVGAGNRHTCAVVLGFAPFCWGSNSQGQVGLDPGNPGDTYITKPNWIDTSTDASHLALGWEHTCAVLTDETVRCWGQNQQGQLGTGSATPVRTEVPTRVDGLVGVKGLGLGGSHSCAALTSAQARCWGSNAGGQLGRDSVDSAPFFSPEQVVNLTSVASVAGGLAHSCAVDGTSAWCWGDTTQGQVGAGPWIDTPLIGRPHEVRSDTFSVLSVVRQVATGHRFSCAVVQEGANPTTVFCWGENADGQLGETGIGDQYYAVQVPGLTNVEQVECGRAHACALLADRTVRCWGTNVQGQLGIGSTGATPGAPTEPVVADQGTLGEVVTLAVGGDHACAVRLDGSLVCWGRNDEGQLGNGLTSSSPTAVRVVF